MTKRQIDFCDYYIENNFTSATQAAIKAGYSKKTAGSISSENLQKPEIRDYLQKKIKKLLSHRDDKAIKLLKIIEHAASFDIRQVIEWDDIKDPRTGVVTSNIRLKPSEEIDPMDAIMISGISQMRDGSIRLKIVQKEKAWDMLANFTKLINDESPEDSDEKKMDDKTRKERLAFLLEKRDKRSKKKK